MPWSERLKAGAAVSGPVLFIVTFAVVAYGIKPDFASAAWSALTGSAASPMLAAVVSAVAVCGVLSIAMVAGISRWEEWDSRRRLAELRRQVGTIAGSSSARESGRAAVVRSPDQSADKTSIRSVARRPHSAAPPRSRRNTFVAWPIFGKLLSVQKAVARQHERPFTLLHLLIGPGNAPDGTAATDQSGIAGRIIQQLLGDVTRSTDVASISPSGDCFVLMPETAHDDGRAFAQGLAERLKSQFGDQYQLEIRQFTYVRSQRSAATRSAGRSAVA